MGSVRAVNPVKLFFEVRESEAHRIPHADERLEARLISEYGFIDHRLSLIPTDGTIHRLFLSFERLVETGNLVNIRNQSQSIEEEFSAKMDVGFLDNRRVVIAASGCDSEALEFGGNILSEPAIEFKNGGIHFSPTTRPGYRSSECREFFSAMRRTFRGQLRSMCLLRR